MIKRWFNSRVQTEVVEIDYEGARGTLQTIEGISKPFKFLLIRLPDTKNALAEIMFHNLTDIEKETIFDILGYELYDETYRKIRGKFMQFGSKN